MHKSRVITLSISRIALLPHQTQASDLDAAEVAARRRVNVGRRSLCDTPKAGASRGLLLDKAAASAEGKSWYLQGKREQDTFQWLVLLRRAGAASSVRM